MPSYIILLSCIVFLVVPGCRKKKDMDEVKNDGTAVPEQVTVVKPPLPAGGKQPRQKAVARVEAEYEHRRDYEEQPPVGPNVHVAVEGPHGSVNVHSGGGRKEVNVSVHAPLVPIPPIPGVIVEVEAGRPTRKAPVRPVIPAARAVRSQPKIPPGHYPPPGKCRIWYPDRPPGQQPPPGDCNQLRRRVPPGAFLVEGR